MRAFLFTLAFAAVHGATRNCSIFAINEVVPVCPRVTDLEPGGYVTQCMMDICNTINRLCQAEHMSIGQAAAPPGMCSITPLRLLIPRCAWSLSDWNLHENEGQKNNSNILFKLQNEVRWR